jgi:hypothetical protein
MRHLSSNKWEGPLGHRNPKFFVSVYEYQKSRGAYGDEVKELFVGKTGIQLWQERTIEGSDGFESELFGERVVCKIVREDEGLAHALDSEQAILGIVLSVCKKDFCCDTGTDGSDKMKNVVLGGSVRRKEKEGKFGERERLLGLRSGAASSWEGWPWFPASGRLRIWSVTVGNEFESHLDFIRGRLWNLGENSGLLTSGDCEFGGDSMPRCRGTNLRKSSS